MALRSYKVGNGATDTPGDIKRAGVSLSTGNYMTLESAQGTDFQVTALKTWYITKLIFYSGTAGGNFSVGYADAGVPDQASAPTTPINLTFSVFKAAAANTLYPVDVMIPIPAGKYPFIKSALGAFEVEAEGIEI